MASNATVVIVLIFIIIVFIGIGVGLYFFYKWYESKNDPTPGPPPGPAPPTPGPTPGQSVRSIQSVENNFWLTRGGTNTELQSCAILNRAEGVIRGGPSCSRINWVFEKGSTTGTVNMKLDTTNNTTLYLTDSTCTNCSARTGRCLTASNPTDWTINNEKKTICSSSCCLESFTRERNLIGVICRSSPSTVNGLTGPDLLPYQFNINNSLTENTTPFCITE